MTITEKIIALRTEKRIKSSEIANALDLHHSNYLRIEKRDKELSINQLESIAKVLGVSLMELLNYGEGVESLKVDSEKVKELENRIKELEKWLGDKEMIINLLAKDVDNYRKLLIIIVERVNSLDRTVFSDKDYEEAKQELLTDVYKQFNITKNDKI